MDGLDTFSFFLCMEGSLCFVLFAIQFSVQTNAYQLLRLYRHKQKNAYQLLRLCRHKHV
jgi:hypothetical protein